MITAAILFVGFLLGFTVGVFCIYLYAVYLNEKFNKARSKYAAEVAKVSKEIADKAASAKERINKALDISEQQFAIVASLEGPQSGPMHGKHKQQMNAELKRLEEEKMTLLKSVLEDGYDPKFVVVAEDGTKETIKLSDFIKNKEGLMEQKGGYSKQPVEPKRKLSLVKNTEGETE